MADHAMLDIRNLNIGYKTDRGVVRAVRDVNFTVRRGQIVGLVGESGCGKSTVLYSILGLIRPPGRITGGQILYNGNDLASLDKEQWKRVRGKEISMIFQDPMTTLNPAYKVGNQIREVIRHHKILESGTTHRWFRRGLRALEKKRVIELMEEVGIPSPHDRYAEYPHQFSGGMQQRILIAMALACEPDLLLADEPTTALDVTIQAQILDLLKRINRDRGTAIIMVTHDLAMAAEFCQEIAVMYAGQIVERGPVDEIIARPKHPYTQGLLRSIPRIGRTKQRIEPIPGQVIDLLEVKDGCAFMPRCPYAEPACGRPVAMTEIGEDHQVRCVMHAKGDHASEASRVSV